MLTRPVGVALLPSLVLFAWRARDLGRALASLAVAPLLFVAYLLYLWADRGDPFAFARAQDVWTRHVSYAGPLGGIWDGLRAGWAGVRHFFFQAEDGIRDLTVTGVQTCALPI